MLLAALTAAAPSAPAGPVPPAAAVVPAPAVAAAASGWQWPLAPAPAVVRPFHAPPTPWSAGHRGVDLAARTGQQVRAPVAGRVAFTGLVAGRAVLVLRHEGGLRTSYEPVTTTLTVGSAVAAGQVVGVVTATPGHCLPAACVHWGLRRGSTYLDPLTLLAAPGRAPAPVLKPPGGS